MRPSELQVGDEIITTDELDLDAQMNMSNERHKIMPIGSIGIVYSPNCSYDGQPRFDARFEFDGMTHCVLFSRAKVKRKGIDD